MAITKDEGRQWPLVAKVDFAFGDFGASGVVEEAIVLPPNSRIIGGELVIETVFDSGTSDTLTVGDGDDDDRYAAGVNGQAAARTALTLTGKKYTAQDTVDIKWTGVGAAPAQGAGFLLLFYTIDERAGEVQES